MTSAGGGELVAAALAVLAALTGALGGGRGKPPGRRTAPARAQAPAPGMPGTGSVRPPRPVVAGWRGGSARRSSEGARWADRRAVRGLAVGGTDARRLGLGTVLGPRCRSGRTRLAAEPAQSVAVVGPTQSGKTTGLAVPAILAWQGPVLAASVKTDLVRDTIAWRRRCGRVWCFDPGRATGLARADWSPLATARTWPGARRVAADLTEVARAEGTTPDGEFWYATAAKLLAPLLFAAAVAGASMADVVRWVDTQEVHEVLAILEAAAVPEALQAARASWQRDDRQRSAVYTTAETVLDPFAGDRPMGPAVAGAGAAEPLDLAAAGGRGSSGRLRADTPPLGTRLGARSGADIDPEGLFGGANSLYLCAPAHDQRRLRGVFVALVKQVIETGFARASRTGQPLDPPLLVVLDEAANIAPLADLDGLAATCAGHGIQLVTVWQDLAQVRARYGERAATVVNNHRAKLFLSGTSDPLTLDHASHLAGEEDLLVSSFTTSAAGDRTVTASPLRRPLLPPDALRRMPPGTGVLLYGSLPPVRVALRPWYEDPVLAARGRADLEAARRAARRRWRRLGRLPSRRWQPRASQRLTAGRGRTGERRPPSTTSSTAAGTSGASSRGRPSRRA